MPATMMHLCAALLLCPQGGTPYLLGSILPDCLDADREKKDRFHLRDQKPEDRLTALIRWAEGLDLEKPFSFGALWHLYLDYLWDNGPQSAHRRSYTGKSWFVDYRRELSSAGSRCAQRLSGNAALWARLAAAEAKAWQSELDLPDEEARAFLLHNARWHTETVLPESDFFTDEAVDRFLARSRRAFIDFLRDFFPHVLCYWQSRADGITEEGACL